MWFEQINSQVETMDRYFERFGCDQVLLFVVIIIIIIIIIILIWYIN
jgi:ABC-type transport system involved in cytochrome bd biosynthesis fused ATPase/permease subunit